MEEELRKLERAFDRLQLIEVKPTVDNMEKLLQSLYDLRDVYNDLKQALKEGEELGRATPDSE